MTEKPVRMDIMPPPDLYEQIDRWRRQQRKLPPMTEAARQLIRLGLSLQSTLAELADAAAGDYHDGSHAADCAVCSAVRAADEALGSGPRVAGVRQ